MTIRAEVPTPKQPRVVQTIAGQRWPMQYMEHCRKAVGPQFTLRPIDMPQITFLSDPDEIRAMSHGSPAALHPGAGAATLEPLIGRDSFMLADEAIHLHGRRHITPWFARSHVPTYLPIIDSIVSKSVSRWPMRQRVAVYPLIKEMALRIILRVIFSEDHERVTRHLPEMWTMFNIADTFVLQEPRLRHLPGYRAAWEKFAAARAQVDATLESVIQQRRREQVRPPRDLCDGLISATSLHGTSLSAREIRDHIMSMLLAGHETIAGELAWAMLLLGHHPGAQDQLSRDVSDPRVTAVINETMRCQPVFLFTIPREVVTPTRIGDWTHHPTTHLAGVTYLMHNDPRFYACPADFRPQRFLETQPPRNAWLPWGGGRKHCLGRHFAMLELAAALREIASRFRVRAARPAMEEARWRSAILVPRNGAEVYLEPRTTHCPRPYGVGRPLG